MTHSVAFILLMNKTPMQLFQAGGVVMWPMILLSFVALTVVIERVIFALMEKKRRKPEALGKILAKIEAGDLLGAAEVGKAYKSDFVARVVVSALENREGSMIDAFGRAASKELARFSQGQAVLDMAITAAPLLGLLGTVTGMMGAFGKVSGDLSAPVAITGGIAEALVATATGLFVAVTSLVPYSFLNSMHEEARRAIDEAGMSVEMALAHSGHSLESAPADKTAEA